MINIQSIGTQYIQLVVTFFTAALKDNCKTDILIINSNITIQINMHVVCEKPPYKYIFTAYNR